MPFENAKWITSALFADFEPLNLDGVNRKEYNAALPEEEKHVRTLFRRTFRFNGGETLLRISADDYYKLYLNGQFVGQGPAPGYHFQYYWNEYDLAPYLREGENEIVADVYYCGAINRAYNSGDRRMGLITEGVVSTNEAWEYSVLRSYVPTCEVTHHYTLYNEHFDSARLPDPWERVFIKDYDHTFYPKVTKSVSVYPVKPILEESVPGGTFYDFGTVLTAGLRIRAKGNGTLRILVGEETEDTPIRVRYEMRCSSTCEDKWTLHGEETYEQYEYRSFRYAAVIGDAEIEEVTAIVRHYPFDEHHCNLETDNAQLKAIWNLCKNTIKYGAQEVFVDCPTREKGQYAGDMTVTSASHLILTDDVSLLEKAIDDQLASLRLCDGMLSVTPGSLRQQFADHPLQFPILVLRHYSFTKDKVFLKKCLAGCENVLEFFKRSAREDGLILNPNGKDQLVDWPRNLRNGYRFAPGTEDEGAPGCHNVINAFYIGCTLQTEQIKDILGIPHQKESSKLIEVFNKVFFNKKLGCYRDCDGDDHSALHSNVLPVYYGFHAEGFDPAYLKKGMTCGVYMAYFLMKGLCRLGEHQAALDYILSEETWTNMLREDATTCFEAWGKEQKWNTSLCHPWASAPIPLLVEDLLPAMPHLGKIKKA